VVLAGGREEDWERGTQGLSARDIAMNVALPEVDGRILARAVSFKAQARFDALTECPIVAHVPRCDRVAFTADLAGELPSVSRLSRAGFGAPLPEAQSAGAPPRSNSTTLDDVRLRALLAAVERHRGNVSAAARELGGAR